MTTWLTEYQVRKDLLDAKGIGVSHSQLLAWRKWGMLEQGEDGLWGPDTIARAARIHELGKTVDAYARRAILLKAEGVPVPPVQLQRAMAKIAKTIRPHLRKMKRVDRALAELFRASAPGLGRGGALPKGWRPPPSEDWKKLIEGTDIERFRVAVEGQSYFLGVLKTLVPGEGEDALTWIPDEELLTLLTIRHLAAQAELGRRAAVDDAHV